LVREKGIGREGYRGISQLEMKVVETEDGDRVEFRKGVNPFSFPIGCKSY